MTRLDSRRNLAPQIINLRAFKRFSYHTRDCSVVGTQGPSCPCDDDISINVSIAWNAFGCYTEPAYSPLSIHQQLQLGKTKHRNARVVSQYTAHPVKFKFQILRMLKNYSLFISNTVLTEWPVFLFAKPLEHIYYTFFSAQCFRFIKHDLCSEKHRRGIQRDFLRTLSLRIFAVWMLWDSASTSVV